MLKIAVKKNSPRLVLTFSDVLTKKTPAADFQDNFPIDVIKAPKIH